MTAPRLTFTNEAGGIHVDLERLVASRLLLQANSGGGKSWMLRYLLEQTHGKIQQIVLDPEGEFSTLRERFDYLLAGKDGDVPAEPKTAKVLARRLLELGASAVIDLYDLNLDDRRKFVRLFLEELMHLPRALWRPLLVVVDEAHNFAPEKGQAESTNAVIALCTQGRKRGFSALLATQRLSKLHKDAAAELLNKLIGRTGLDIDIARAGDELGFDKQTRLTLRDLQPGNFYAFGPAISRAVLQVRSGKVTTTHPEPGKIAPPAPPPPAAVKKLVAQLQDLAAQAKNEALTIEEKDREIARLSRELRAATKSGSTGTSVVVPDEKAITRAVAAAENRWSEQLVAAQRESRTIEKQLRGQVGELGKRLNRIGVLAGQIVTVAALDIAEVAAAATPTNGNGHTKLAPRESPTPRPARVARSAPDTSGSSLPKGEHLVLTAVCQYPDGATREQISILTGYKRSTRDAYIQRLSERGLVEAQRNVITPTEGAEKHLGDCEPLPTGSALQDYWMERLPAGEGTCLGVLIAAYPDAVSRDEISEQTGYKRSTRDAYLQRLDARKLIEFDGRDPKANRILFEER